MSKVAVLCSGKTNGQHFRSTFVFDSADPYAVNLTIDAAPPIVWTFGRELLSGGGTGNVIVKHSPDTTYITLRSNDGCATLEFSRFDIASFVYGTYAIVPEGTESQHIDWEREFESF